MAWIWITLTIVLLAYLLQLWLNQKKLRKLPPGPKGLPILGHLHLLGKTPHQDLAKLAKKHGPIMSMQFGFVPNIIVSSPHAAKQFLKTYDLNFADRPSLEAAKYISYEQRNLSFSSYGPYWRDMRKLCTIELFSNLKINTFQAMRKKELGLLVSMIEQAAKEELGLLDIIGASIDTSATTIEWILSELLKHPTVMKKVQKELEQVVGMDRMVEEADLENLEYLDMVIKEAFRLHPVAPLLLPHQSIEDCTIGGFFIPKKSRVVINAWAIGRDPNVWADAEKFLPERFVGSDIDLRGRNFELLPFGSGRRGCPGMQLGLTIVRLVVAQLLHCFDWELPNGIQPSELDMTEEFGLVVSRANHLVAVPTCRLNKT